MRWLLSLLLVVGLGAAFACGNSPNPLAGDAGDGGLVDVASDVGSDGTLVDTSAADSPLTGDSADASFDTNARNTVDLPDDVPGMYQIHVLYVEPSDTTAPKPLDTDGSLRRAVGAFNAWIAYRLGGPKLRIDTYHGVIDVTYVKLPAPYSDQEMAEGLATSPHGPAYVRDRLEAVLKAKFADPNKLYLTYWDGLAFARCGGSSYPPSLPGHFTAQYVGGIFDSTYLTADAPAGTAQLAVYSTAELSLPPTPFSAMLGSEAVAVAQVQTNLVILGANLTAAHASGEPLVGQSSIPACRSNPFSSDGKQLNYWEYGGAHECMHPLGIVSPSAPDFAQPPVAPGHLSASNPSGTSDLMYQGTQPWSCPSFPPPPDPTSSLCQLDPQHRDYVSPSVPGAADLARSVFLDPLPSNPVVPASW